MGVSNQYRSSPAAPYVVLVWAGLTLTGCGGNGSPTDPGGNGNGPDVGSIQVTASTTNNLDPNGFEVTVGGSVVDTVEVNGSVTILEVPSGNRTVSLAGVAPNCALDGQASQTVPVTKGSTVSVSFSVTCTDPPDGRILVWRVEDGMGELMSVMNTDGSGMMDLVSGGALPVFSPDGSRIAFSRSSSEYAFEVHVMNKDASDVTRLSFDSENDDLYPAWSPDGSRIAYSGGGERSEIFVVNPDGSGLVQLTDGPTQSSMHPTWSPDGSKIAFSSGEFPPSAFEHLITVMSPDGTGLTPLRPVPSCPDRNEWQDYLPVWSPDGSQILFRRSICAGDPGDHLYVMSPEGENLLDLGRIGDGQSGDWSPDGTRIVYIGTDENIYVMNADGTNKTLIKEKGQGEMFLYVTWGG